MKRIDTATKAVDLFGAGKHGWRDGNLGGGIPATDFNASIMNNLQEELCSIVEAAGIALDGNTRNQVLLALRAAGVFTTPTTGDRSTKVATTQMFANEFASSIGVSGYQKLPSGFIVQWGGGTSNVSGIATFTHPIAFPNANLVRFATYQAGSLSPNIVNVSGGNLTQTLAYISSTGGAAINAATINMCAIGY